MKRLIVLMVIALAAVSFVSAGAQGEASSAGDKPTLKVATHTGWASHMPPANNDLPVYAAYEELTGIHIEWENVQVSNYQEVMTARLAAGMDLPDIINMATLGDIAKYGRDGLIIPLNDLIEKHAPNIKAWWAEPENAIYKILDTSPDGNIYGVGGWVLPAFLSQGIMYNKIWLDKLGLEMPETTDEFVEVMRAFRDEDPNGNNKADEIPLIPANGTGYLQILGNAFGFEFSIVSEWQVDSSGDVYNSWATPRYKDYLTWMNLLYEEHLLDPEYASNNWDATYEKIGNDLVGTVTCWMTFAGRFSGTHPEADDKAGTKPIFVPGVPLEGPYGDQYLVRREVRGGGQMAITKDCDQPDVAMRWIDFIRNAPEALELQNFGIEGVTYNVVDGEIVPVDTPDKPFTTRLYEVGGGQPPFAHLQWQEGWKLRHPKWVLERHDELLPYYVSPTFPLIQATEDEQDVLNKYSTEVDTYHAEMFSKFVTGQEPLQNFDAYVANLKKVGLDELTEVRQQQYERYLELAGK